MLTVTTKMQNIHQCNVECTAEGIHKSLPLLHLLNYQHRYHHHLYSALGFCHSDTASNTFPAQPNKQINQSIKHESLERSK